MTNCETASSPISRPCPVQVTDAQFHQFAELIYRRAGIRISPQKKLLLSNRLRRRLRQTGHTTFCQYFRHLRNLKVDDPEWDAFLQEITTHETHLFRDQSHWNWFREAFLPDLCALARQGKTPRTLRIWSAACSSGDEPVTAACCIAAVLPDVRSWRIRILGTDIGEAALEQAEAAAYGQRAMRLVPEDYRRRFFVKDGDEPVWRARPILTDMLAFRRHNLIEPLPERLFDMVILKNVLIYFDAVSKAAVLNHVRAALRPSGWLMAGAAEGVANLLPDFQRLEPWLYRRNKS
jgi:chemotaxis protein methyltransferase CheR